LIIIGNKEHRAKAIKDINEFLTLQEEQRTRTIDAKFKSIRKVLIDDSKILREIEDTYRVSISYDFVNKLFTLSGEEENIEKAKKELLAHLSEQDKQVLDPCPICFDNISNCYRLENCKHIFCETCLRTQILLSVDRPKIEGIRCSLCKEDDMRGLICVQDLINLLDASNLEKLWKLTKDTYLDRNQELFHRCPSPDCPQFFRTAYDETERTCDYCFLKFCIKCKKTAHGNVPCETAEKELLKKTLKAKQCPKCKMLVEKIEGCDKIHCHCGAYFCWVCEKQFEDAISTYEHIRQAHRHFQYLIGFLDDVYLDEI